MRLAPALLLAALSALGACSSSTPTADTSDGTSMAAPPPGWTPPDDAPPPPAAATDAPGSPASPAPPAAPAAADLAGTWSSPSCGARTFERVLELRGDGTFTAHDRVSPCPPGARCVWSGIVTREGTWSVAGDRLALAVTKEGTGPKTVVLPTSLAIDGRAPVEEADGTRCVYTRR